MSIVRKEMRTNWKVSTCYEFPEHRGLAACMCCMKKQECWPWQWQLGRAVMKSCPWDHTEAEDLNPNLANMFVDVNFACSVHKLGLRAGLLWDAGKVHA